ncbi:MAG: hypothetical protein EA408_04685 [Marinilabiliales bacterium]|nr:MAG: hypothetical protein EA408_04685 [Marinilabiliales bacterium]
MKNLFIKGVLVFLLAILGQADVLAQPGRFGETPEDSIRALRNLSMYGDRYRNENYNDAMRFWRILINEFPMSSRNIYVWAERDILGHMIENAETEEERKAYLDTAMMMFDKRMKYYEGENFGDPANVMGRKGLFYFRYNRNIEESEIGYNALEEAIRLSGDDPSHPVIATYMTVTVGKYAAGFVDSEHVIETYTWLMDILNNAIDNAGRNQLVPARDMVEDLFANSGAADCDALIELFADRVHASPEDAELLTQVNDLLSGTGCTDSDLYLATTEKLHVLDPSAQSAITLSAMYRARNNDDMVIKYLQEAIELQDVPEQRANYYLELAIIANQVKNDKQLSRQYARSALNDNPSLGRAHIHIGSLYASENNCFAGEEDADFKNRTVYWVAVDRFNEAKRVDSSVTAEADRLIETYSIYFPDTETLFFHGYQEGDSYTVGCWINESTRVRARR